MKKLRLLLHLEDKRGFIVGLGNVLVIVHLSINKIKVEQGLNGNRRASAMQGSSSFVSMPVVGSTADEAARGSYSPRWPIIWVLLRHKVSNK